MSTFFQVYIAHGLALTAAAGIVGRIPTDPCLSPASLVHDVKTDFPQTLCRSAARLLGSIHAEYPKEAPQLPLA